MSALYQLKLAVTFLVFKNCLNIILSSTPGCPKLWFCSGLKLRCFMNLSPSPCMQHVLSVLFDVITLRTLREEFNSPNYTDYRAPTDTQTTRDASSPLVFSKYNVVYIFHLNIETRIYILFRATPACKLWLPLQIVNWCFCSDL